MSEPEWECVGASYVKKMSDSEVCIETDDGQSWSTSVRRHLANNRWLLLAEVRGLSNQSVAQSVAVDLYNLAKSIIIKDVHQ